MRHGLTIVIVAFALNAHAAQDAGTFSLHQSAGGAKEAHGAKLSKIVPTVNDAAMKFFVVDKDKGPVKGVVIFLTGPDKKKYYTDPTDSEGYAEVLVPVGRRYDVTFLSLGRREIAATVPVEDEPNQSVKLTLRYKRELAQQPLILAGVNFDTAKATIRPESFSHLDAVVEFMVHKKSARVEISGHTDNVGNAKTNKTLSEKRAQACRNYIVSKGIDKKRLDAIGFGDERPIAPNDTDEGRQNNRRIEAKEL